MKWQVSEYMAELGARSKACRGRNEKLEREMARLFPPRESEKEYNPCVVVDLEGIILLWYLPGLLALKQQV